MKFKNHELNVKDYKIDFSGSTVLMAISKFI